MKHHSYPKLSLNKAKVGKKGLPVNWKKIIFRVCVNFSFVCLTLINKVCKISSVLTKGCSLQLLPSGGVSLRRVHRTPWLRMLSLVNGS